MYKKNIVLVLVGSKNLAYVALTAKFNVAVYITYNFTCTVCNWRSISGKMIPNKVTLTTVTLSDGTQHQIIENHTKFHRRHL